MFVKTSVNRIISLVFLSLKRYQGTYTLPSFKYHLIDESEGIQPKCTISKAEALLLFADMVNIRRMENTLAQWYRTRVVRGFCHLYNGQEAVCTGIFHKMRQQDTIISSYRSHGYMYLMSGRNPEPLMAELVGSEAGCSKGRGGSMHIYANQFYGGNGIVGAQIPLGTGIALAHQYNDTKAISFTVYGDGAANQGQVFEAYNMAKLWKLPVIYIIENNQYAMGTTLARGSAYSEYYKTCMYIPGISVDGMDVLATIKATEFAINFVNNGNGPIILEMHTYRYHGHSMSDPGKTYRTRDEIKSVRKTRDPIQQFQAKILEDKLVTEDELKSITVDVRKRYKELVKLTKLKSLDIKYVSSNIQKNHLEKNVRGVNMLKPLKHTHFEP